MFGNESGELGDTSNIMGRAMPFHDVKVWGGTFNNLDKNSRPTDTFWLLLQAHDHHQKIML
jgi:hypothetical protein